MSQDFQALSALLTEFSQTISVLKKEANRNNDQELITKNKDLCKTQSETLVFKFKTGRYQPNENMKVQKLTKDFERLFQQYQEILEQIKSTKISQQVEFEKQYNQAYERRQTVMDDQQRKRGETKMRKQQADEENYQDEDDLDASAIQEIDTINPEVEHYGMLIQEKNSEIQDIQFEVLEVYKIMQDVAKLANDQGKQLDIAESNINTANANVKVAAVELEGAQVEHKSYKKKMMGGVLIAVVIVCVIVLPIVL